jgi:hypothetical protein
MTKEEVLKAAIVRGLTNEEPVHGVDDLLGQVIASAVFDREGNEHLLRLTLEDGRVYELGDFGQSCCEYRYITTDDDAADLEGGRIFDISSRDMGEVSGASGDDVHEQVGLRVTTDIAAMLLVTHNEHNGYYRNAGGFSLCVRRAQ